MWTMSSTCVASTRRESISDGDTEFAPGIQLVHIGGHTAGLQAVRVHTERGWVVLASDASHYYANLHKESPFPIVFHVGDMLEGYRKLCGWPTLPITWYPATTRWFARAIRLGRTATARS